MKHFTALVRKAKFAFNKTLHITFVVWLWGAVLKNIISDRFSTETAISAHI